eukprot:scaffold2448_cov250-Pinguiococcus_pyrenoidosus.AAC.14
MAMAMAMLEVLMRGFARLFAGGEGRRSRTAILLPASGLLPFSWLVRRKAATGLGRWMRGPRSHLSSRLASQPVAMKDYCTSRREHVTLFRTARDAHPATSAQRHGAKFLFSPVLTRSRCTIRYSISGCSTPDQRTFWSGTAGKDASLSSETLPAPPTPREMCEPSNVEKDRQNP